MQRRTTRRGPQRARREGVTTLITQRVPRAVRISLGVFALLALSTLLLAGWLREVTLPELPQIRPCGITAAGSSR